MHTLNAIAVILFCLLYFGVASICLLFPHLAARLGAWWMEHMWYSPSREWWEAIWQVPIMGPIARMMSRHKYALIRIWGILNVLLGIVAFWEMLREMGN